MNLSPSLCYEPSDLFQSSQLSTTHDPVRLRTLSKNNPVDTHFLLYSVPFLEDASLSVSLDLVLLSINWCVVFITHQSLKIKTTFI